ncbi:hypothetical protein ACJCHP_002305 [Enterobacter asburiae]
MSNIDKQALIAKIKKQTESFDTVVLKEDEANALLDELEAKKDAEPVAKVETVGVCWYADNGVSRKPAVGTELFAAPPAPVNAEPVAWLWSHRKHPSEVTLVRPEDDERAEGALWSGWHCQPLTAQVMSEHQPSTSPQQEKMAKPKK